MVVVVASPVGGASRDGIRLMTVSLAGEPGGDAGRSEAGVD
jgi:hypothetical protein